MIPIQKMKNTRNWISGTYVLLVSLAIISIVGIGSLAQIKHFGVPRNGFRDSEILTEHVRLELDDEINPKQLTLIMDETRGYLKAGDRFLLPGELYGDLRGIKTWIETSPSIEFRHTFHSERSLFRSEIWYMRGSEGMIIDPILLIERKKRLNMPFILFGVFLLVGLSPLIIIRLRFLYRRQATSKNDQ